MWSIFFVLPNLSLKEAVGNEYIALVPHDDVRIIDITASSPLTKSLIEGFEDQFRKKIYPSSLIIENDAPDLLKEIDTIISFRNIFALSTIIAGHVHCLTNQFVAYPVYSDYFDFYPITISGNNDGFCINSPSVLGFEDDIKNFRGQTSPSLLGCNHHSPKSDDYLFELLEKVWRRRFINKRINEWSTRVFFRSLEMAYQASAMPFKNHSTIFDYGASISLWVSAFEILSHPHNGKADLESVLKLLGMYDWNDKAVKRKTYKVKLKGQIERVNLVQKLYKELYDARNDFLHGNPVNLTRLYPFKKKDKHLIIRFAPLVYKVALLSFLDQFKDKRNSKNLQEEYISQFMKLIYESDLVEAISKSKK